MARRSLDQDIDRLYQLPLDDFTRDRNALAKELGGDEGKRIKSLPKPSASAWAVNQLYWRDRAGYDALIRASEHVRAAHRAALAGRKADLREADAGHRDAINAAMSATVRLAKEAGQSVSSAMQMEIARTLQSLPADKAPGRLEKPLSPGGFEALQGMPIRPPKAQPEPQAVRPSSEKDKRDAERERKQAQAALQDARRDERHTQAAVAGLQKQVNEAERKTAAAKAAWDRAQAIETRLRTELQQAQDSLDRARTRRRELDERSS